MPVPIFVAPSSHRKSGALEVEMRLERIIAAVTRTLATATTREIFAVVLFTDAMRFHLWRHQLLDGMPMYPDSEANSSMSMNAGGGFSGVLGSKRDRLACRPCQPVLASCPVGICTG